MISVYLDNIIDNIIIIIVTILTNIYTANYLNCTTDRIENFNINSDLKKVAVSIASETVST